MPYGQGLGIGNVSPQRSSTPRLLRHQNTRRRMDTVINLKGRGFVVALRCERSRESSPKHIVYGWQLMVGPHQVGDVWVGRPALTGLACARRLLQYQETRQPPPCTDQANQDLFSRLRSQVIVPHSSLFSSLEEHIDT